MRATRVAAERSRWQIPLLWLAAGLCALLLAWLVMRQPTLMFLILMLVTAILLGIAVFFGRDGVFSLKRVLPALLAAAILFPYIRLPAGIPDVRPEFIIVLTAWGLLFLGYLATGEPIRLRRLPTYKWFGLFGFSIVLSMVYASFLKGQPLIGRDFWELVKVFLYLLVFALAASLNIRPVELKRYYKFALIALILSALFGFLQYVDFAGINQVVSPYYAPTQMRGLLIHRRVTGTTPNPNEFGALMVLAASLSLSGGLFLQERRLRILCWSALPVFGMALVLTLSRTALVSLFLASIVVLFLFLRQRSVKHRVRRVIVLVMFGCVVGLAVLPLVPEKAIFRFSQLRNFTEATSWQERVENWRVNFDIWKRSPWLGWGPGKANMSTIVDNEYLLVLRRYGVVGLMVFLGLFGSLFLGLSHIRRINGEPPVVALSVALQGTLVGCALYMLLAAVYHSLQLMPILLLFLGLAYSQWRPRRVSSLEGSKP